MRYDSIIIEINQYLTANDPYIYNPLLLTVLASDILAFNIDDQIGAADDAFEIYGRTAKVTCIWRGQLQAFLQAKNPNQDYREYLDGIFTILDSETNEMLFRGALRLDDIVHDYDAGTVDLVIRDSLDIWISQAKKTYFTATEENNLCSLSTPDTLTLQTLLTSPVSKLTYGMASPILNYTYLTYLYVTGLPCIYENYANDFSAWTPTWQLIPVDVDRFQKFVVIKIATDPTLGRALVANLVIISFIADEPAWIYRVFKAVYANNNVLQPVRESVREWMLFTTSSVEQIMSDNLGIPVTVGDSSEIILQESTFASYVDNGITYSLSYADDIIYTSGSVETAKLNLQNGNHSYADIANLLITTNALTMFTDNNGIRNVVNSAFNQAISLTGGYSISPSYIINQQREGLFADTSRIDDACSIMRYNANMLNAMHQIYDVQLAKIGCRLKFNMPLLDFESAGLTLFSNIVIDNIVYMITLVGFPENGLVYIEAVGEWE